jgi:hypothetical protein
MLQHVGQPGFVSLDIHILDGKTFPGVGFTSRPGIGSGILAENQYFVSHMRLLEVVSEPWITPAGKAQADFESAATWFGCEHFEEACNAAPGRQTGL